MPDASDQLRSIRLSAIELIEQVVLCLKISTG